MVELGSVKTRINTSSADGYEYNPHSFHQSFLLFEELNPVRNCGFEPASANRVNNKKPAHGGLRLGLVGSGFGACGGKAKFRHPAVADFMQ